MKALILAVALLGGCTHIQEMIPSFWDANQSARITDVRLAAEEFDCDRPHLAQIDRIQSNLRWFDLYSESKGPRQTDVRTALKPLNETVSEFRARTVISEGSTSYCRLKVTAIRTQAARAASAVQGRF